MINRVKKQVFAMFRSNKSNQEVKECLQLTTVELNYLRREYQKPRKKKNNE